MPRIEYSSNNSGGGWWLSTDDWRKLEQAGWDVKWKDKPFLGALATEAYLECDDIEAAQESFTAAIGQSVWEEGCECCGRPHNFYEVDME